MKFDDAWRNRLMNIVIDKNLDRRELAQRIGVTVDMLNKYIQGSRTPRLSKFPRIAQAVGVSVERLLFGRGKEGEQSTKITSSLPKSLNINISVNITISGDEIISGDKIISAEIEPIISQEDKNDKTD